MFIYILTYACVHMLINKPRPNRNRFMQLEEPKISECRESNALILHTYISSLLFYILESCTGKKLCYHTLCKKIFFSSLNFCDFYFPSLPFTANIFTVPYPLPRPQTRFDTLAGAKNLSRRAS